MPYSRLLGPWCVRNHLHISPMPYSRLLGPWCVRNHLHISPMPDSFPHLSHTLFLTFHISPMPYFRLSGPWCVRNHFDISSGPIPKLSDPWTVLSHENSLRIKLKAYKCDLCDYKCRSNIKLTSHFKAHTGEKSFELFLDPTHNNCLLFSYLPVYRQWLSVNCYLIDIPYIGDISIAWCFGCLHFYINIRQLHHPCIFVVFYCINVHSLWIQKQYMTMLM